MQEDNTTENQLMLPDDSKIAAMTQHIGILSQGMQFLQQVAAGIVTADTDEIQNAIAVMQESSGFIELFHAEIAPVLGGAKAMIETLRNQRDEALGELEEVRDEFEEAIDEQLSYASEEIWSDGYSSAMEDYEALSDRVQETVVSEAESLGARLRERGDIDGAERLEQLARQAASNLQMVDKLSDEYQIKFRKEAHEKHLAEIEKLRAAAMARGGTLNVYDDIDEDEEEDFEQELEDEA